MTYSKVQIFNIALNILGVSNPVENANITNNKTILLNNYYDLALEYVLKDFDWNFASVFKTLTLSSIKYDETNYKYCYDYPNDCVFARDLFTKETYILQKFSINALEDGSKVILTDAENAILRYTKRIDREIYFTPEFVMALAYYLASLTASVIVGSLQKGELAYEKYKQIIRHAKVINASEGTENLYSDKTYIDERCE